MIYPRLLTPLILLALFLCSCSTSKEALDKSTIEYTTKKASIIKELAAFAIVYTTDKKQKIFRTDTLSDKKIKKKFNSNGYGGLIIVTYSTAGNNIIFDLIDSTVIFKQITVRGVTEIIYDFAADKKKYEDDRTNPQQFVFLNVTDRIFFRRRPIPMM